MHLPLPPERLETLRDSLHDVPAKLVNDHLQRLDQAYFLHFNDDEIKTHLEGIATLSLEHPCHVRFEAEGDDTYQLIITGFDYSGLFSVIAGLLTIYDLSIEAGRIFTYYRMDEEERGGPDQYLRQRKKIIDQLQVRYIGPPPAPEDFLGTFGLELERYILLLGENRYIEARNQLTARIGSYLSRLESASHSRLLPITIEIDNTDRHTVLHIQGSDTPAFLFSLANALALRQLNIHSLTIQTREGDVDDAIYITDRNERPITDPDYRNKLRMAVVLIKQFTQLLPLASDFDQAMHHFDLFLDQVLSEANEHIDLANINNQTTLKSLARIFGAGDYLWEEFVRMQYTSLLPMLQDNSTFREPKDKHTLLAELQRLLATVQDLDSKRDLLNRFKDQELFRIDISHLIYRHKTFMDFSEELTALAEAIVTTAFHLVVDDLTRNHGRPRHLDGEAHCAVLALGKFGGRELGYASDLELMLVYEGSGLSDSPENPLTVSEFFIRVVQGIRHTIRAKQKGIFEIDLRLRPYGKKGQLACSLQRWRDYYAREGGGAYDFERQALLRLRPVCGNTDFCSTIMEERDRILFQGPPISAKNTLEMRHKQQETLVEPGKRNAKFSPGGLIDVEYSVQFLQLAHGREHANLRVPNTVQALEHLLELGLLTPSDFQQLFNGYAFLRRLINALRMVRGSARDLEIPDYGTAQFSFLAKRMDYLEQGKQSAEDQLRQDIEQVMQTMHRFFSSRFVEGTMPVTLSYNLPDLLTSGERNQQHIDMALAGFAVREKEKTFHILQDLYGFVNDKHSLLAVLMLAQRHLASAPDADKVILHLEGFIRNAGADTLLLKQILFHPDQIELLCRIFGHSHFLAGLLISEPSLINYVIDQHTLLINKTRESLHQELEEAINNSPDHADTLDLIRRFRNRETLRIGLRDIYLDVPLERTVREISDLSDTIIQAVYHLQLPLDRADQLTRQQTVIAMGKLGGRELNYSSDIDLIFVHDVAQDDQAGRSLLEKAGQGLIRDLSASSPRGQLFRVDMRLRPYGRAGTLTGNIAFYEQYYQEKADGWELQAWLKARAVAGNLALGGRLVQFVQALALQPEQREPILNSITHLRKKMLQDLERRGILEREVKLGPGGIRTIEFLIQRLQIANGAQYPDVVSGNSLQALAALREHRLIPEQAAHDLEQAYRFLRKVEHRIQLLGLQQDHVLPEQPEALAHLAKRSGFQDRLDEGAREQFEKAFQETTSKVQAWATRLQHNQ